MRPDNLEFSPESVYTDYTSPHKLANDVKVLKITLSAARGIAKNGAHNNEWGIYTPRLAECKM